MLRRTILMSVLVAAIPLAHAQNFPTRPVRLVVANPPGGTADLVGRLLAKQLGERWRQPAVVDNRGGAAGLIGTDIVAKAVPDGYTVLVSAPGPLTTHMFLGEKLPYDPLTDLAPITLLAVAPSVLMVSLKVPAKSVAELIAYAKAHPGKLSYASSGTGNPSHLHGAMLASIAQIDIFHVPHRGGGPALNDLVGGHVDIFFNPIPAMLPLVKAGRVRALAVTSEQRFPGLPDVPTMRESGLSEIGSTVWYGALVPAKTPAALIKRLHTDFVDALKAPEVQESLSRGGAEGVGGSPQQFAEFLRSETEKARKLLQASGAKRE
jgi:tripartite-type tricarboxylate transporter receptor subunit TctC